MKSIELVFEADGCVLFGEDDVPHKDALVSFYGDYRFKALRCR
jgi:hypothetical protein